MKVHHAGAFGTYQEHQQNLLLTVIKTTNIIFLIGILVNSIWFPIVFWKTMIQNIVALLVILIGECLI